MRRTPLPQHAIVLDLAGAAALHHEAWWTGKHAGEQRHALPFNRRANGDDRFAILGIPLAWIERDTLTELGCDDPERGRRYAQMQIDMPIDLRVPRRRPGSPIPAQMRLMDGGHRTAAARLRGDSHISALVKLDDLCDFMRHHGYTPADCRAASDGARDIAHRLGLPAALAPLDDLLNTVGLLRQGDPWSGPARQTP
ncbi:hypothetical protein [Geopseudomonas aromaticivorans]